MTTETGDKIIEYINQAGQATANDIFEHFQISRQAIFKQLKKLQEKGLVKKVGSPPKVFYSINKAIEGSNKVLIIDQSLKSLIQENFLDITSDGQRFEGVDGFIKWCERRGQDVDKTAEKYGQIMMKYDQYKKAGLIDGMYKLKKSLGKVFLDEIFYLDFYSLEIFGKTKLGQMLLYAKQSQDRKLIRELVALVKGKITFVINNYKINAIAFVPPTVRRQVQFMKELQKELKINLPSIKLVKVYNDIVVPQKTLNKLEDRVNNARNTIFVDDNREFNKVLIIDDALGSGATMNEIAEKLKSKGLAKTIIGLAITGSVSGFEVISEV